MARSPSGPGDVGFVVRRIYDDDPGDQDDRTSHRVLVDRLWPRGMTKEDAALDQWAKDVAPSTGLRRWYGHDPAKFDEFARRYDDELDRPPAADLLTALRDIGRTRRVILLTATRDLEHSGARVLHDRLVAGDADRGATSRPSG